jgi:P27 family predicted phage terminase small subunit
MGKSGPPKMPTALRVLHGERRPSEINRREPQAIGRPRMPMDMSDEAKRVWRRVWRGLGPTGVLRGVDEYGLRLFAEAWERYRESAALLRASGPLVVDRHHGGQAVKNPLHQIVRENAELVRQMARELGLTPAARTGLEVAASLSDDPTGAWLKERGAS